MTTNTSRIGLAKDQLDTPALCLDLDLMESNIRTMVAICRAHDVQWRPHAKCHKSPALAQQLVQAGAIGVTCATLTEAEHMAAAGVRDLLIANLVAGEQKLRRLVTLASISEPIVCIDDVWQATEMSRAMEAERQVVRVLLELEIGMNRVGVPPSKALRLAQQVSQLPGLELAGVMAYEGHLLTIPDPEQKAREIQAAIGVAIACQQEIERAGLPCPIVSCGGTGSFPVTVAMAGVTEIQAGGAIFMDAFYREACQIRELDHALTVTATIVSHPTPTRAVMDAGRKALNAEIHRPHVAGKSGVTVDWLSAEHGVLRLEPNASLVELGERIELIPGYADLTTVLHECFFGVRRGHVEAVFPILR